MRDHPRTGGEKRFLSAAVPRPLGSPPHRRGKEKAGGTFTGPLRITPAQAGKSSSIGRNREHRWDHPRTGGEKRQAFRCRRRQWGSPPHRRGKGAKVKAAAAGAGITPAQAGKRLTGFSWGISGEDHPRTGGEKLRELHEHIFIQGSPPHRRGKVLPIQLSFVILRITPAQAGKRLPLSCRMGLKKDHPRTGGEKAER